MYEFNVSALGREYQSDFEQRFQKFIEELHRVPNATQTELHLGPPTEYLKILNLTAESAAEDVLESILNEEGKTGISRAYYYENILEERALRDYEFRIGKDSGDLMFATNIKTLRHAGLRPR